MTILVLEKDEGLAFLIVDRENNDGPGVTDDIAARIPPGSAT